MPHTTLSQIYRTITFIKIFPVIIFTVKCTEIEGGYDFFLYIWRFIIIIQQVFFLL